MKLLLIALGGALGTFARYTLSGLNLCLAGPCFPPGNAGGQSDGRLRAGIAVGPLQTRSAARSNRSADFCRILWGIHDVSPLRSGKFQPVARWRAGARDAESAGQ